MISLSGLKAPKRSRSIRKRVGRGQGSGLGKTAGRGGKGQKARSGNMRFEGFEGGQMPLQRRLPKFGFINRSRIEYQCVSVGALDAMFADNAVVDMEALISRGAVTRRGGPVKVLANGTVAKPLTVRVDKATERAVELIEKAGGKVEQLSAQAKPS